MPNDKQSNLPSTSRPKSSSSNNIPDSHFITVNQLRQAQHGATVRDGSHLHQLANTQSQSVNHKGEESFIVLATHERPPTTTEQLPQVEPSELPFERPRRRRPR